MSADDVSLLFIHGFNSGPEGHKVGLLREFLARHGMEDRLRVPQLPVDPRRAMAVLEAELAAAGPAALVGSSLGGFYATWLAVHHDLKAVLINPVVQPWRLLADNAVELAAATGGDGASVDLDALDNALRHYEVEEIPRPENLLVMVQAGDEVLDWRDAAEFYADCSFYRSLNGSHAFDDFDAFIPLVLRFCGIRCESP